MSSDRYFEPLSPPPSSAPPPLPTHNVYSQASMGTNETDSLVYSVSSSYQNLAGGSHGNLVGTASRAAALPQIRYDDENEVINGHGSARLNHQDVRTFFSSGDASLLPNIGLTNSYDTSLFGLALHELLEKLRLTNMIASLASIGLLLFTWLWSTLTLHWDRLVLSCYLGFFAVVLLAMELCSLWNVYTDSSRASFVTSVDTFVKANFGLLRHPIGKSCFLFLQATLCWAIGGVSGSGIAELAIGLLYFGSAASLLALWFTDPAFRSPFQQEYNAEDEDENFQVHNESTWREWSYYSHSLSQVAAIGERTGLLSWNSPRRS